MSNPYEVLGLPIDADDVAIRTRYLELVKQFSPEHHPDRFKAIRAAYEQLRDLDQRILRRVFGTRSTDSIDAILEEMACQMPRRRLGLKQLLNSLPR